VLSEPYSDLPESQPVLQQPISYLPPTYTALQKFQPVLQHHILGFPPAYSEMELSNLGLPSAYSEMELSNLGFPPAYLETELSNLGFPPAYSEMELSNGASSVMKLFNSACLACNEIIKKLKIYRVIETLHCLLKYFNALAIPIFFCYIASVYFQQFVALFPLSTVISNLIMIMIAAIFGLLLMLNRRYSDIEKFFYFNVMLVTLFGVIWINLLKSFYGVPKSEETLPDNAFSLSPPAVVLACVFMFSSVNIPEYYLVTNSFRHRIKKIILLLSGYFTSYFYITELHLCSIYSAKQFFISAASFILHPSQYFTEAGEPLYSIEYFVVPLMLGLFSLCPVMMMFNENHKKIKEAPDIENNTESENNKKNVLIKYYSLYFHVIAFILLCPPLLLIFGPLRNILLTLLIFAKFIESFILYPLKIIVPYNELYPKSFKRIAMILLAVSCAVFSYSVRVYILSNADLNLSDSTPFLNEATSTFATTLEQ
ncbi:hypothetical protein ENBRE01_2373, partial [Enteropsectra breve]